MKSITPFQRVNALIGSLGMLALAGLTGCSNLEPQHQYVVDSQKVFQVQQAARSSATHVDVIWVNPPLKKVKKN
jgi:hypothetical protein